MAQLGESPRIILPPNHRAVYLLINRHHCENLHSGMRATLSDLSLSIREREVLGNKEETAGASCATSMC